MSICHVFAWAWMHAQTDRQPENIMPPAPAIRLAEADKQIDVDETVLWDVIVAAAKSMQLIRL